jgi:hypothetical protein
MKKIQKALDNNDNKKSSKLIKEKINIKFTNSIIQVLTYDEYQKCPLDKNLLEEMVRTYFKNLFNHLILNNEPEKIS